jgi:hypothetical protein
MKLMYLTQELKYPPKVRGLLSTLHADVVTYAIQHYNGKTSFKREILMYLNLISYHVMMGDSMPKRVVSESGLVPLDYVDDVVCKEKLGDLFVPYNIKWDGIQIVDAPEKKPETTEPEEHPVIEVVKNEVQPQSRAVIQTPTPATHLYLVAPKIPRFDVTRDPWYRSGRCEIYRSLPIVPKRQIDITITTDVNTMTDAECVSLYPNRTVRTRAEVMYQQMPNVTLDQNVGLLLPIKNFTDNQVRDNIIKYPHIFRLKRFVCDDWRSFYQDIEIDGELHPVDEVIDTLPEFDIIPKDPEFIKEYVVRRYLLERDVQGIEHKYPLYGSLNPFLTLFTTPDVYRSYGFKDTIGIARQCVKCRVDYLQSRNPFLRSTYQPGTCIFAHRCQEKECDGSCPIYGETSYLIERNNIPLIPEVFCATDAALEEALGLIRKRDNVVVKYSLKPFEASKIIAYCGICETWKGNAFHCSVYHLNYQKYLDDTRQTWTTKEVPDDLSYQNIWMQKAKILIVSNFEYIKFDDFAAQTLMNTIYYRNEHQLKTILVLAKNVKLNGNSPFFDRMVDYIKEVTSR